MLQGLSVQSRKLFLAFVQALVSRDIVTLCLHICISVVLTYPSLSALSTFLRGEKKKNPKSKEKRGELLSVHKMLQADFHLEKY